MKLKVKSKTFKAFLSTYVLGMVNGIDEMYVNSSHDSIRVKNDKALPDEFLVKADKLKVGDTVDIELDDVGRSTGEDITVKKSYTVHEYDSIGLLLKQNPPIGK